MKYCYMVILVSMTCILASEEPTENFSGEGAEKSFVNLSHAESEKLRLIKNSVEKIEKQCDAILANQERIMQQLARMNA